MRDDNEQLARFEEMGEDAVRILAYTQRFTTQTKDLRLNGLPKRIRNRNGVGKPSKRSKSTLRAPLKTRLGRLLVLQIKPTQSLPSRW